MFYELWFPGLDLRFPFGEQHWDIGKLGPHYVMSALLVPFVIEHVMALPELSIVWRHRSELTDEERQRPEIRLLVAYILAAGGWVAWLIGTVVVLGFPIYDNRQQFIEEHCGGGLCFTNHWLALAYAPALAVAVLASWFQGDQAQNGPRALSNKLRVVLLSQFSFAFVHIGCNLVQIFYNLFADGLVRLPPSIVVTCAVLLAHHVLPLLAVLALGTCYSTNELRDLLHWRICVGQEDGTPIRERS